MGIDIPKLFDLISKVYDDSENNQLFEERSFPNDLSLMSTNVFLICERDNKNPEFVRFIHINNGIEYALKPDLRNPSYLSAKEFDSAIQKIVESGEKVRPEYVAANKALQSLDENLDARIVFAFS